MRLVFCLIGSACIASALAAGEVVIVTADGKTVTGEFVGLDAANLKYLPAGGMQTAALPVNRIASIQIQKSPAPPRDAKYDLIELTDGSTVLASQVSFRGKSMLPTLLTHPSGVAAPAVELPMTAVSQWMRNADDVKLREAWKKLAGDRVRKDRVLLRQGEGFESLAGSLFDATETGDAFAFEQEGAGRRNLPIRRITGGILVYHPNSEVLPPTLCKVVDQYGNAWNAAKIEIVGKGLTLTTVAGATVTYPALDVLVMLDFAKGNLIYLSDLTPTVVYPEGDDAKAIGPEFSLARKIVMDRAGGGQDLIVNGKRYAKGIAIPKDTSCTFKLDAGYREFKFLLAAPPRGRNANFLLPMTILVDDRPIFAVTANDVPSPNELAFNVKDAKEIRIVVGSRGFDGDRQLLVDARLQK